MLLRADNHCTLLMAQCYVCNLKSYTNTAMHILGLPGSLYWNSFKISTTRGMFNDHYYPWGFRTVGIKNTYQGYKLNFIIIDYLMHIHYFCFKCNPGIKNTSKNWTSTDVPDWVMSSFRTIWCLCNFFNPIHSLTITLSYSRFLYTLLVQDDKC